MGKPEFKLRLTMRFSTALKKKFSNETWFQPLNQNRWTQHNNFVKGVGKLENKKGGVRFWVGVGSWPETRGGKSCGRPNRVFEILQTQPFRFLGKCNIALPICPSMPCPNGAGADSLCLCCHTWLLLYMFCKYCWHAFQHRHILSVLPTIISWEKKYLVV